MQSNFTYYILLLVLVIIGVFVVKKVASCLIKTVITIALIAIAAAIWWLYFR